MCSDAVVRLGALGWMSCLALMDPLSDVLCLEIGCACLVQKMWFKAAQALRSFHTLG